MNDIEERIRTALQPYRARDFLAPTKGERPRHPRRRLAVQTVGVAAVVVVVTFVVGLLPLGRGGPDPAAAALLRRFAQIAQRAAPEVAPQPGQYVYSKTRMLSSRVYISADNQTRIVYSVPEIEQRWLGLDGSGRVVTTTGHHLTFPTPSEEAKYQAYLAAGGTPIENLGHTTTDVYKPGELTWRDTSSIPTDPSQLAELINDRKIVGGPSGDWESFALATDLLRDSYARPAVRAALYSYMTTLSGIEMIGPTEDALGRRGVALAATHDGVRNEVVFDRATGDILEERMIALETNEDVYNNPGEGYVAFAYAGDPVFVETYLSKSQVVDSTTQTP